MYKTMVFFPKIWRKKICFLHFPARGTLPDGAQSGTAEGLLLNAHEFYPPTAFQQFIFSGSQSHVGAPTFGLQERCWSRRLLK